MTRNPLASLYAHVLASNANYTDAGSEKTGNGRYRVRIRVRCGQTSASTEIRSEEDAADHACLVAQRQFDRWLAGVRGLL